MPASFDDIVARPPVDALAYQARELQDVIRPFLNRKDPPEAQQLARLLYAIASWLTEQLAQLSDQTTRQIGAESRALALARLVHALYEHVRYLRASAPSDSAPAVQDLVRVLAEQHAPPTAPQPFHCVLRPKSEYNFESYAASKWLELQADPLTLDPNNDLGVRTRAEILDALWQRASRMEFNGNWGAMPGFVGVLAFAGLDAEDILLMPLLAHELGHAFDYGTPGIRPSTEIARKFAIQRSSVKQALPQGTDVQEINDSTERVQELLECAIRETLADLLATKMLGLAFFVALAEFLKSGSVDWPQRDVLASGYPGIASRLRVVFEELLSDRDGWDIIEFLEKNSHRREAEQLKDYLDAWKRRLQVASQPTGGRLGPLLSRAFAQAQPEIAAAAARIIPDTKCARMTEHFFGAIDYLREEIPPDVEKTSAHIASLLSAGWTYQLVHGEEKEGSLGLGSDHARDFYRKTCRLIHKALELAPVERDSITQHVGDAPVFPRGILSKDDIYDRITLSPDHERSLAVVPFSRAAIQAASIDVRLGNWFSVARRTRLSEIDISERNALEVLRDAAREQHYVPFDGKFVIHPGDFVLGVTLEFFGLPNDITCTVEGRSSIGRTGLIVATATPVAPGFRGVLVLELANTGTVPLALKPGMGIGQLVLSAIETPVQNPNRGRYHCQMRP